MPQVDAAKRKVEAKRRLMAYCGQNSVAGPDVSRQRAHHPSSEESVGLARYGSPPGMVQDMAGIPPNARAAGRAA
jgi:hypothetical protein